MIKTKTKAIKVVKKRKDYEKEFERDVLKLTEEYESQGCIVETTFNTVVGEYSHIWYVAYIKILEQIKV